MNDFNQSYPPALNEGIFLKKIITNQIEDDGMRFNSFI